MFLIRLGHNGIPSVLIIKGFLISGYVRKSVASAELNVSFFRCNVSNRLLLTLVSCRSIDQLVINRGVLLILRDTGTEDEISSLILNRAFDLFLPATALACTRSQNQIGLRVVHCRMLAQIEMSTSLLVI